MRKRTKALLATGIMMALIALALALLPNALHWMGLHPEYRGERPSAPGRRALIVTTSQSTLGADGAATGVYSSELTIPYYVFEDAGISVDVASIAGGEIPMEPMSLRYPLITATDRRAQRDPAFQDKVKGSPPVSGVRAEDYDLIYLAGGWGAAYDLAQSAALGELITDANARGKVLGSVCHGALGFLSARETDGSPFVAGKQMTAVTDKQVAELNITQTPLHPETELKRAGALYESGTAFRDMFASHVVTDGRLITGQNQNDSAETAHRMILAVLADAKPPMPPS